MNPGWSAGSPASSVGMGYTAEHSDRNSVVEREPLLSEELPEETPEEDLRDSTRRFLDWVWDVAKTWGPALLIVLFIRSVIAEPFRIPSGSMVPTLEIGDHILVTKYSYGLRLPLTRVHITDPSVPDRGDVVVFVKPGTDGGSYFDQEASPIQPHRDPLTGMMIPENGRTSKGLSYWLDLPFPPIATLDFVKRVVGLPGEEISVIRESVVMANGEKTMQTSVFIDGVRQDQQVLGEVIYTDDTCTPHTVQERIESLNGVPHKILMDTGYRDRPESSAMEGLKKFGPVTVPEDHVFVMGDNRDHSFDSRGWGFVPLRNIKGKAQLVWLSYDKCEPGLPLIGSLRGDRAGQDIE
jgi:signal peptidase I